jgi:hypothetical protein
MEDNQAAIEVLRPHDNATVLRRPIEDEWDEITIKEINKAIASMPERVAAARDRDGAPIPF